MSTKGTVIAVKVVALAVFFTVVGYVSALILINPDKLEKLVARHVLWENVVMCVVNGVLTTFAILIFGWCVTSIFKDEP